MTDFNPRSWYHLYFDNKTEYALIGTNLFKNGLAGAVFVQDTDLTRPRDRWQLFPINDQYYVLRTREGQEEGFLGTLFNDTTERTVPRMVRGNVTDDSVYWKIHPWSDGTFYLTNKRNGTNKLAKNLAEQGSLSMESNDTEQGGLKWSFEKIADINDDHYRTVSLPTLSTTIPADASWAPPRPSSSSDPSSPPPQSGGGLSSGAKAAIGGAVGGVAVIALIVLGLYFWRLRKRAQTAPVEMAVDSTSHRADFTTPSYELNHGDAVKYEMQDTQFSELPQTPRPVELEGNLGAQNRNRR